MWQNTTRVQQSSLLTHRCTASISFNRLIVFEAQSIKREVQVAAVWAKTRVMKTNSKCIVKRIHSLTH